MKCQAYTRYGVRCERPISKGNLKYCGYHSKLENRKVSDKVSQKISKKKANQIMSQRMLNSKLSFLKDVSTKSKKIFNYPNKLWASTGGRKGDVKGFDDGSPEVMQKYHFNIKEVMRLIRKRKKNVDTTEKEDWGFKYSINLDDYRPYGLQRAERTIMRNTLIKRINDDYNKLENKYKKLSKKISYSRYKKFLGERLVECFKAKEDIILNIKKYNSRKTISNAKKIYEANKIIYLDFIKRILEA